jgi:predicted Zn-dependent protease with MMP-like domain
MDPELFEDLVAEALETLPDFFLEKLNNVVVLVEDWPDRETLRRAGARSPAGLLGFYHGVPLTERTSGYNLVAPDEIIIYQKPIERICRTRAEIIAQVRRTVMHEIAHHFGISDARLRELGAY